MATCDDPRIRIVPDAVYTPEEAAKILRVTRQTVYAWMNSGALPNRRIERRRRLLGADILDALANDPERQE